MKLLNFCYLLYLTFVYLTFVTSFTNTLLTFLFVLVLPFHMQLFLLSCALVLSALVFQMNADLWGHVSTDAFLDIALWIYFTIFHCYFFLPFVHPFYLFIYHFISLLITFPFCFSVDLHLWSLYFTFRAFCTCAPSHSVFSLIPRTHSINTSRCTCIFLS